MRVCSVNYDEIFRAGLGWLPWEFLNYFLQVFISAGGANTRAEKKTTQKNDRRLRAQIAIFDLKCQTDQSAILKIYIEE